jgi:tetratricopeptide (TPR) repeat protein
VSANRDADQKAGDAEQKLRTTRQAFDTRLASLENRAAGVWGGRDFADAKMLSAESVGARDAGDIRLAQSRLDDASKLLEKVERKLPQALAAQLDAGEKALASGQKELAAQAFDLAKRIDPSDRRVASGQSRVRSLSGVLPLLADAENAERARNYARAAQDYSQALSLDANNANAKAGLARANAAFGDDNYAKSVGAGFAALGAGRLDEAHDSFEKARTYKPNGPEAAEGLRRVGAVLTARGFATIRQHAGSLEAQERWDEAVEEYDGALKSDPSLSFAQQGKARAGARADLNGRLQALLDRPERLESLAVRQEAKTLLDLARAQDSSGPVLRSQIARLEILLPDFDKPVRLSLVSDNATQVAIPSIGAFGTFARREIELKPGKYTVIGTRNGYRDVRHDITVAPGQNTQTVSITCSEPI